MSSHRRQSSLNESLMLCRSTKGIPQSTLFARLFICNPMEKTMRKTPVLALALMSAFMIPALQQLHAAPQTIDGVVTDSMCGKKHMMPGKTDAQCVQECI